MPTAIAVNYENVRVLVLEDELHIRRIICRLLREIGFRLVDEASNGSDGFRELLRVRPNVVLCDIHMDHGDGMDFLRRLRALDHPELAHIPVVFLTADTNRETVLAARDLRVDGYLAKPISLTALKERVDAVLRRG